MVYGQMTRLLKALFYVPSAICFAYAAVVVGDAFYVGLIAPPEVFADRIAEFRSSNPGTTEISWAYRSPGHFFWMGFVWAAVFTGLGFLFKRLLKP